MAALSSELSPPNLVLRIRISGLSCISFCFEEHVSNYCFAQNPSSYKEGGRAFSWLVDKRRMGSFIAIVDVSDLIIQRLPQDHFLRDYFPRDRNVCLYPWYYVLWFLETVSFNKQLSGIIKKKIIGKLTVITISWISITVPDKDPLQVLAAKIENIMHIYSISHNNDIHY